MKAGEIATFVGGVLHGDSETEVTSVADIATAKAGQLAFAEREESVPATAASCVLIRETPSELHGLGSSSIIVVSNPKLAFAKTAALLHPLKSGTLEIHPSAVVASGAEIGPDVFVEAFVCIGGGSFVDRGTRIHAGAKIGDNTRIGSNCVIHPNVVVEEGCTIGNNVILHAGVVIGADGFGYVRDDGGRHIKFPQIGTVVIEDDVEIGANTCVDRGALGETRIGSGTKIDSLVQVGHNVQIGKRCVIAAQTGISGSVVIEDDCVIGGQVGFGDHVRVQSGAVIGSQAGVLPGKIVRPGVWWGTPIQPLDEYKRQNAHMKGLARLKEDVKILKKKIERDT
jgi:UDP-3-O-[3-hydroxymyristoyl] glucosamine N-acyltransferase